MSKERVCICFADRKGDQFLRPGKKQVIHQEGTGYDLVVITPGKLTQEKLDSGEWHFAPGDPQEIIIEQD